MKLNGIALIGDFKKFDKASFSHGLNCCENQTIKLDRFQLPPHLRYKGHGPRILRHLLVLYKRAGCAKILVPSPTTEGTKLYEKVGFKRNALNTLEINLKLSLFDKTNCYNTPEASSDAQFSSDGEESQNENMPSDQDNDSFVLESSAHSSDSENESDLVDDRASPVQKIKTSGTSKAGFTQAVKGLFRRSNRLNETFLQSMSDQNWDVDRCEFRGNRTGYIRLTEVHTGSVYEVLPSRAPKAKLNLSYDACMTAMTTDACKCRKKCNRLLIDPAKIAKLRSPVYSCASEQDVNSRLTEKLKDNGGKFLIPVDGEMRKVCSQYYSRVHSVCLHRVKQAARLARNDKCAASRKQKCRVDTAAERVKYNVAYSFWSIFFEQNCQRPNNEVRIFPVAKSYNLIYKEYFIPWFERHVEKGAYDESNKPKRTTFMRARKHEDFHDVKERAKHTHARCTECSALKRLVLEGFKNGAAEEEYIQRRRIHDTEVKKWRELESTCKSLAVTEPSKVLVIMHDGTEALGLPRLTNRTLKNLDPTRFEVVPWLGDDLSAQRKDYIYTAKKAFPKDSNTLISQVHAMIRRAKSDYKHPRHKARKLVLIADSASENKNNTLFAYVTDLVENKWFDEVELIFGPVGHTHNGVDACHKIHNQNVGDCASGDIGHFVHNYPKGYSGQHTVRPQASFLSRCVDWSKYYVPCVRKIAGFTKTKNDPHMIRGFRIARQRDNTVSLVWKMDPASEKEWRGADGFGGTPGFYMLKSAPAGLPEFVSHPDTTEEEKRALGKLTSLNMRNAMVAHGLSLESVKFNHQCALEKSIIPQAYVEDEAPAGEWGRGCLVGGSDGARAVLREIKHFWDPNLPSERSSLWALPIGANGEHRSATNNEHHYSTDDRLMASRNLALVRYADERSQVGNHPNNAVPDGGGWVCEGDKVEEKAKETEAEDREMQAAEEALDDPDADGSGGSEANRVWRFEEDFSTCQVNKFCIGLIETSAGPSPYLFVGKITAVNPDERTFKYKPYKCVVNPWTPACLDKPWHTHPQTIEEENPHYAVMKYFRNLKANKAIPKAAVDAVRNRRIQWPE